MFVYLAPPCGAHPLLAHGRISQTGEEFQFRLRGGKASIEILKLEFDENSDSFAPQLIPVRRYEKLIETKESVPDQLVSELISKWITQHLNTPKMN